MSDLTPAQKKHLLLLKDSEWRRLCATVQSHFGAGGIVPSDYSYLLALSGEQWQTISSKLALLRYAHKDKLRELRRQTGAADRKNKKRDYMRNYMRLYRRRSTKESQDGQASDQSGDRAADQS